MLENLSGRKYDIFQKVKGITEQTEKISRKKNKNAGPFIYRAPLMGLLLEGGVSIWDGFEKSRCISISD